jgi:hypothetical protein
MALAAVTRRLGNRAPSTCTFCTKRSRWQAAEAGDLAGEVGLVGVTSVGCGFCERRVVGQKLAEPDHALIGLGSDSAVLDHQPSEMTS